MVQAIFFDFNGVIIDDEPLQLQAYQKVLGSQGIELTREEYYASMGMDDKAFVIAAYQRASRELSSEALLQTIEGKSQIHRQLIEHYLPLFPGVVTFLKTTARRYQIGLVSMARRVEIDYVLERAELASLFSVIVSAEKVRNHKPDSECYVQALAKLNQIRASDRLLPLAARECLVIEDATQGIQAASVPGMRTIGVTNSVSESALRAAGAEIVTRSLADWTVEAVDLLF